MGATNTLGERRSPLAPAALLAAVAWSAWASGTSPFTVPADVAVSVAAALFAGALLARRLAPAGQLWRARSLPAEVATDRRTAAPWVALFAVALAVELASYFHPGPRSLYPTFSSLSDDVLRYRPVKAAVFFGWLAGGWHLVTR